MFVVPKSTIFYSIFLKYCHTYWLRSHKACLRDARLLENKWKKVILTITALREKGREKTQNERSLTSIMNCSLKFRCWNLTLYCIQVSEGEGCSREDIRSSGRAPQMGLVPFCEATRKQGISEESPQHISVMLAPQSLISVYQTTRNWYCSLTNLVDVTLCGNLNTLQQYL